MGVPLPDQGFITSSETDSHLHPSPECKKLPFSQAVMNCGLLGRADQDVELFTDVEVFLSVKYRIAGKILTFR